MARSSLLGIEPAAATAPGRDAASLGPGDSSDSGSDRAGLDDDSDPNLPVDVALRDDQPRPLPLGESTAAADDGDAGVRDGADIGVDRVFTPGESELDDEAAQATLSLAGDAVDEDEEEEAEAEVDGAEKEGAQPSLRKKRPAGAPRTREAGDETEEDLPGEVDPAERRPGRD